MTLGKPNYYLIGQLSQVINKKCNHNLTHHKYKKCYRGLILKI